MDASIASEFRRDCTGSPRPVGDAPEQPWEGRAPVLRDGGATVPPIPADAIDPRTAIGYDALWESMERCRRGVGWKSSVQSFVLNAPAEVMRLSDELHDGTYRPRPPKEFVVTYPKRRVILGVSFRDRVVQRSYNDNVIYPCMSRSWIYDNYACQQGKGTDFARERVRAHLERAVRAHGPGVFALRVDVRGYYDHMRHEDVGVRLYAKCPMWAARFACETLRRQYGGEVGVRPGSQLAQIAGVDYLDEIDHAIKERMGVRGYGRYMDDLVLVHHDEAYLESCLEEITRMMRWTGLAPHPTKTRVAPASEGFSWLGFDYRVTGRGRIAMTIKPDKVKAMRRHVGRLWRLERDGLRPEGTTWAAYEGWRAHAAKGDSASLITRCDAWLDELTGLEMQ